LAFHDHWPTLLKKDGDELFDHYRHMLESLGKSGKPAPSPQSSPTRGEEVKRALAVIQL